MNKTPKLLLAPMEGVTDHVMRELLTSLGGIDLCVTEFIRVCNVLLPKSVYHRICPELKNKSHTKSGVPVFVQLLGSDPVALAENAAFAVELGAIGIDLNFGCPAKTVNKNDGGASLLRTTDRIYNIVKAVRNGVPKHIPVTAKIRLGYEDRSACIENSIAITEAGAHWLTVHCRTKTDGYKPPAYWEWMPKIREVTNIPLIANGEIWTVEDFERCREVTQCETFMIGRACLRNPYLFNQIKQATGLAFTPKDLTLIQTFFDLASQHALTENYAVTKTKQWLSQLRHTNENFSTMFENLKTVTEHQQFREKLISFN